MFDGLLKSKFYSKCKSSLKLTKTRVDMIKRKRSAMQKYLKNDVVDLLKNGLDSNAYGRVEGLWNELNLSKCYDYVEQCCTHISSYLAAMDKNRECPEECKEAVSSLMFAAARFSDLPELRDLRTIFTDRYGNSIEFYVNKEFANKLKSGPPERGLKLQLMQDIASECGLEWDSKTFEQKIHKSPRLSEPDIMKNGHASFGKEGVKDAVDRRNLRDLSYGGEEISAPIKDIQVDRINRKVQQKETHGAITSEEDDNEKESFQYKSIPPPYVKAKTGIKKTTPDAPPTDAGAKVQKETHKTDHQDDSIGNPKPKPKSVRRRFQKPRPGADNVSNTQTNGSENKTSKITSQHDGEEGDKQHLKNLTRRKHDERDEEEKVMDRLLLHYSRKKLPPDTGESEGSDLQPSHQKPPSKPGREAKDRGKGLTSRTASLPAESSPTEATRSHARASSFQPDVLNANGHVHPNLPEYDDFVARLAALRGTLK
ncbi:OLC1v1014766C1 [Oldenlandia corymbosa var. corymbosa]|uniref:OLC1v1014766C1 n=1 Tax=Oldenlandia corymbosa var. corymbosa TaxID=529605 RepID=A0AAV1E201_OLDCO|nr:OLC1v1014766C1 [Oldenlandia corymbosa var. corymbosa]